LRRTPNVLGAKRLQYLKELVPGAQRMALLFDKEYADACRLELDQIRDSAKQLKVDLELVPFEGSGTLDNALGRVRQSKPQALMSPVSGTFEIDAIKIGRFIREQKLPRSSSRSRPRNTVRFFRMARTIFGHHGALRSTSARILKGTKRPTCRSSAPRATTS
jgi:hypothetical protein